MNEFLFAPPAKPMRPNNITPYSPEKSKVEETSADIRPCVHATIQGMTIDAIAEHIRPLKSGHTYPILIAVEGFGGAGKTTFATSLKELLGDAYVISIDDFIVKERLTDASWDSGVFDRKRLEVEVLAPIARHERAEYHKLLWDAEVLSGPISIPDVKYLIVEGISSYHPDIAHYYDYKIWVHALIEIAMRRGRARDAANENAGHWGIWANNDVIYQEKYHPERQADFIVDTLF